MKKILLFLFAIMATVALKAQVVLKAADMPVVGDIFTTLIDDRDSIHDPGTTGTNKIWDYSNFQVSDTDGLFIQDLNVLPPGWANDFPDGNGCNYNPADTSAQIFSSGSGGFVLEGFVDHKVSANFQSINFEPGVLYLPAGNFTYGSHVHQDAQFVVEMNQGVPVKYVITLLVHEEGDATGTLITPLGTQSNLLRIMRLQYEIDSVFADFGFGYQLYSTEGPKDSSLTYLFVKQGPGCLVASLDADPITNKSISFGYNYFYHSPVSSPSGKEEAGMLVYPNPAKGGTWVKFNNLSSNAAEIRLFDVQGRVLVQSQVEVGNSAIEMKLPAGVKSGVYFYNINGINGQVLKAGKLLVE